MIRCWMGAAIVLMGCTRTKATSEPSASTTTAISQPGETPITQTGAKATPDEILQARLVRAVGEIDETLANREPDVVTMGLFGIGSGGPAPRPRGMRMGATSVSGRLPPEVIQRIVRVNYDRLRRCYERGLAKKPDLTGRATTKFVINRSGKVSDAKTTGDLPQGVLSCVQSVFQAFEFPEPEAGMVTVSYPIIFSPSTENSAPSTHPSPPPATLPSSPRATSPPPPSASSPPATDPLPSRPQPLPEPAPTAGPWPIVVVSGSDVLLGEEKVDSTETVTSARRLQRVDGAFAALKRWHDRWRMAHPRARFPGVAGLRVADDAPLLVVKSVFQTMAYAGFPTILVQSASQPARIVELVARLANLRRCSWCARTSPACA